MTFASIRMLFLIWAVPLIFLIYLYGFGKRRRILLRFASPVSLGCLAPEGAVSASRRWIKAGLVCGAFLFLSLALSGPRYGYTWKDIERKGVDLVIALDCSRSMLATDIPPTRLARAKREVYDLLGMLQGDRVGLVAFAGTAFLQCPLTLDYSAFNLFLEALSPDFLPVGGSDLPGAITTALHSFDPKANSEKAIILITDGESTSGDPMQAAEDARRAGVKIFTIGVGRQEGVPLSDTQGGFKKNGAGQIVVTRLDEESLEKIALATGGAYVRSVAGDMDLDTVYTQEIRGKMAPAVLSGTRQRVWENRFQWPLGAAILLLLVDLMVPLSKRRPIKPSMLALALVCIVSWPQVGAADPMTDAENLYKKGDYGKSLKLYLDKQIDDPDNPEVLYNIGNAYYKLGDFEKAGHHFKMAAESEDSALREKALYNLGNSAFRQNRLEQAAIHYEAALKIDPQDRQAEENLKFVKQLIARKQQADGGQASRQQESQDTDKQEQKDSPASSEPDSDKQKLTRQAPEGKSGGDRNEQTPRPEFGSDMPSETGEKSAQPAASPQPQKADETGHVSAPAQAESGAASPLAAEQMLNRLEDKPGGAMIPAYRDRQVEKDW